MGTLGVTQAESAEARRAFMRALLRDLQALELMEERGMIESGVGRIGAEQEMVLIDGSGAPAPLNEQVLASLGDDHFTVELGRFNLEANLEPQRFEGGCLSEMHAQLDGFVGRAREAARAHDGDVLLTGILPSLGKGDLTLENITDRPRYHALNEALLRFRGGPSTLQISGIDELTVTHENVMLEACNTSFQVHFQVSAEQFARKYNIAQAAAALVLAAAANSPLLFGRRLWHETRIALFQQSIDTRSASASLREIQPRVSFGAGWIRNSALEIFQEDVARFKPLFPTAFEGDPVEEVKAGRVPKLEALRLHNGTVYRWNRACFGVSNGAAHLRIENRVLPAGPTTADEVANAAFWFGLMRGLGDRFGDIAEVLDFDDVHENFIAAARQGLDAQLRWLGGHTFPARELIALKILPIARTGLEAAGIDSADIERYLGIIEARVAGGQTGAVWLLRSYQALRPHGTRGEVLARLANAAARRQHEGAPVHEWTPVTPDRVVNDRRHIATVGQYMVTDLFTVHENDVVDLVTNLMEWKHIRHVPVEDDEHRLVGLVTHRDLLRHLARSASDRSAVAVSEIMNREPITITPATSTMDAIRLMRQHRISCLPVVDDGRLAGIVSEHDLMRIAAPLLERFLEDRPLGDAPPAR